MAFKYFLANIFLCVFVFIGPSLSSNLKFEETQININDETLFLTELYDLLAHFQFQNDTRKYDVDSLENWGKGDQSKHGIEITENNYAEFMQIITNYGVIFDNHAKIRSKFSFIKKINEILRITLKDTPKIECRNNTSLIIIKSRFLKTSNLQQLIKSCGGDIKSAEIFVSDTIFIDSDLIELRSFQIFAILSPHWSIETKSKIDLSGLDGWNYEYSALNSDKSANGKAENGNPGLPGEPGGSFFGLAESITNSHLLTIKSFGGKGGNGQNGGNGVKTERGGHGGIGGDGGFPGDIKFIEICKSCEHKVNFEVAIGWHGDGGWGGLGGFMSEIKGLSNYNKKGSIKARKAFLFNNEYTRHLIFDYKSFLLGDLDNDITRIKSVKFLKSLIENEEIKAMYDILSIYHEFQGLEGEFYKISDKSYIVDFYKSLAKIAEDLAKNYTKSNDESLKILTALSTAILSKISSMEDASSSFIINLRDFSDIIVRKIKDLERVGDRLIIEQNRDNLKKEIDQKIDEIHNLVNHHITPKLEHVLSKLNREIDELIQEIQDLERNAQKNLELLKKQKEKLKILTIIKSIFSVINIFVNAIPGVSSVARIGTEISVSVADKALDKVAKQNYNLKTLEGAKYLSDLQKHEDKSVYLSNSISSCNNNNNRKTRSISKISNFAKNNKDRLKSTGKNISRDVKELKRDVDDDIDAISKVSDKIEQTEQQIKYLEQFERHVCGLIKPTIGVLIKKIRGLKLSLQGKSEASLLIENWELQQQLKQIKIEIQRLFKGFIIGENISQTVDEIIDVLNTLINTFKLIEKYSEQKKLSDYIAKMHSDRFLNVEIKNEENRRILNQLSLYSKSNLILIEYKLFVDAIKQFSFPMAERYFKEFEISEDLSLKNSSAQECVRSAVSQIESFRYKLERSYVSIGKFDKLRHKSRFCNANESYIDGPFYVWKNHNNRHILNRLLEGKEVLLTSRQINSSSTYNMNAVKFNTVALRFKVLKNHHNLIQNQLDYILENNQLLASLTHMGNSYYKCADKSFIISTESQNIRYSFQKIDDEPVISNEVYRKIRSGDSILSPFTSWKMQIVNLSDFDFNVLRRFSDFVDLELVGEGEYYSEGEGLCDGNLEKYYQVENVDNRDDDLRDYFYYSLKSDSDKVRALRLAHSNNSGCVLSFSLINYLGIFVIIAVNKLI